MNQARIPNQEDYEAVASIRALDIEERAILTKELACYLGSMCSPVEVVDSAERTSHLYARAAIGKFVGGNTPFSYTEVDVFASAVLIALEQHPDQEIALKTASNLRQSRNASCNELSKVVSPIHTVGIGAIEKA